MYIIEIIKSALGLNKPKNIKNKTNNINNSAKEIKIGNGQYTIKILEIDQSKLIKSITLLREKLGLGLRESKDLLTNLPAIISGITQENIEKIKQELEKEDMKIEIIDTSNL